jgi:hypothetical protein
MSAGMLQVSELQARVRLCHGHVRMYFSTFMCVLLHIYVRVHC